MDAFHTMTVNTNDPTSDSTAISTLVGLLLDPHPEDGAWLRPRPQDGCAGIPSQDPVRGGEGKGASPRGDGARDADRQRPSEERPASKKRRLSRSAASLDEEDEGAKKDDPFLYYSNDKRRLERLLRRELPRVAPPAGPVQRKTRISFEVDPFLNLICSYPELLDESSGDPSGW